MNINRRWLLKSAGTLPLMLAAPQIVRTAADTTADKADYTLRIATFHFGVHLRAGKLLTGV